MADILNHPRRRDLRGLCRRRRAALAAALTTELYWRYHLAPELNARFWSAFGDLVLAWRRRRGDSEAVHGDRARFRTAVRRQSWDTLSAVEARQLLADCQSLVGRLHPTVTGRAGDDALWSEAESAFRSGDCAALRAIRRGLAPRPLRAAGRPETWRLQRALLSAERRLARIERGYPLNLRRQLTDPAWVARRREQWAQDLAGAAPLTECGGAAVSLAAAAG